MVENATQNLRSNTMQRAFVLGKEICESLCISPDFLAERCFSGKIVAYNKDRKEILSSLQCKSKFVSSDNTTFIIDLKNSMDVIAINKKTAQNFKIFTEQDRGKFYSRALQINANNKFICSVIKESKNRYMSHKNSIRQLTIKYKNEDYLFFYNKEDFPSLDQLQSIFNPDTGEYKEIFPINVYPISNIFFQPFNSGVFDIDLLIFPQSYLLESKFTRNKKIRRYSTRVKVKSICDDDNIKKFIIRTNYKQKIRIDDILYSPKQHKNLSSHQKECKSEKNEYFIFSQSLLKQYAKEFFDKNDQQFKRPLTLGIDFFPFSYNEFCKQYFQAINFNDLINKYHQYINNFLYDLNKIKILFSYEYEVLRIEKNPLEYMDKKCRELAGKYIDDDKNLETIRMYHSAIMSPFQKWSDIYKKFYPKRKSENQEDAIVSKRLQLFKGIATENDIPYIEARRLRDMTEKTRPKIIKEMIAQLKPEGEKEADSNIAGHTGK